MKLVAAFFMSAVTSAQGGGIPNCQPPLPAVGKMLIDDFSALPNTGAAWNELLSEANAPAPAADVFSINNDHDVWTLANAFAWKRGGDMAHELNAVAGIQAFYVQVLTTTNFTVKPIIGPCRNALAYVMAADVLLSDTVNPPALSAMDRSSFRDALEILHDVNSWSVSNSGGCKDETLAGCHDLRPQNHGTYCGAAIIAMEWYLSREGATLFDQAQHRTHLCSRKDTFRGFIGNVNSYSGFEFGDDVSWHESGQPMRPMARVNAVIGTQGIDGCLADDMRRVGDGPKTDDPMGTDPTGCDDDDPNDPPPPDPCLSCGNDAPGDNVAGHCTSFLQCFSPYRDSAGLPASATSNRTGYPWEAMQGLVMQAHILSRAGWQSFAWESSAIERGTRFLYVTYRQWAQDNRMSVVCQAGGESASADDTWVPWIVEAHYNSNFLDNDDPFWTSGQDPLVVGTKPGKNFGFAEWWSQGI